MGRCDWELSGPMQILLQSCSLILFTYDNPDPKRVSACGCVAVTTSLRCIWKNRSQNWLKLSATEPQAVNKWLLDAKPVECNEESSLLGHGSHKSLRKSCPWQRWNLNPSPQRDLSFNATPKTAWPRYTLCICSTGRFDWKKARPKLILQKSILTKNA